MGVEVVGRCGSSGGVRLHGFPHAGGSAEAFRRWMGAFGEVSVVVASCGGDDGLPASVEVPVSALGPAVGPDGVRRRSWERDLVGGLERVRRYRPSQGRLDAAARGAVAA